MFVRIWQYRPRPGSIAEFQERYGPDGDWARLFRRGRGYLGTEFLPAPDTPGEYQTMDRWKSRADWEAFRANHAAEYEELDQRCESLTESEWPVQECEAQHASD